MHSVSLLLHAGIVRIIRLFVWNQIRKTVFTSRMRFWQALLWHRFITTHHNTYIRTVYIYTRNLSPPTSSLSLRPRQLSLLFIIRYDRVRGGPAAMSFRNRIYIYIYKKKTRTRVRRGGVSEKSDARKFSGHKHARQFKKQKKKNYENKKTPRRKREETDWRVVACTGCNNFSCGPRRPELRDKVGTTLRRTGCIFKRRAPTDICDGGGIGNGSRSRHAVSYSDA